MFRLFTLAALSVAALSFLAGNARADWQPDGDAWVFVADADDAPAVKPAPAKRACPNCTTCGDKCECFGGGYYCKDGQCPIALDAKISAPASGHYEQVCDGRSCRMVWVADGVSAAKPSSVAASSAEASPRRSGPIRRIFGAVFRGRLRSGGGCAACGQ